MEGGSNKVKREKVMPKKAKTSSSDEEDQSEITPSESEEEQEIVQKKQLGISYKSKAIKKLKKDSDSESSEEDEESESDSDSNSDDESSSYGEEESKGKGVVRFDSDASDKDISSDSSSEGSEDGGPLGNIYAARKRGFTISSVVPSSIIDNAQSFELKTYLVGQIAKACGLFKVNEIIVLSNDKTHRMKNMSSEISTTEFFVRNLEYIETP